MSKSEKIYQAAAKLASRQPFDKITYADIAKEAGVHWTTVRRLFGSKEELRKMLKENQGEHGRADTKTLILEAASRIFAKYGFERATLDQVAQDAGMTKGAVYWHFSSKSDLYLSLCDRSLKKLLDRLPKHAREIFQSADPLAALTMLLQSEFDHCKQGGSERTLLFFEFIASLRDSAIRDKLNRSFSALFEGTAAIIAQLQQDHLISAEVDPKAVSVTLHSLVNGVVMMWHVAPNEVPLHALAEDIAHVLWYGLQPALNHSSR